MKKSTLIVLVLAIGLGAFVYFYDVKRTPKAETPGDESKPAFSFLPSDVTSMTLQRGSELIEFQRQNGAWNITKPVTTRADQTVADGIADGLAAARISRTLSVTPDRLAEYGLKPPAVTLSVALKNGPKHEVQLGAKDFSQIYAYGIVDKAKDVVLLPESLLVSSDKSLSDLRDRSAMDIKAGDVASFELKNKNGEIAAAKHDTDWKISKPRAASGDSSAISEMLSQVATTKWEALVSETSEGSSKYGLDHPLIALRTISAGGKSSSFLIGKKEGDTYYARDTSRPVIFRVKDDLVQHLSKTFFDLRDKNLIHFEAADLTRVEIHNGKDVFACTQGSDGQWKIEEPSDKKGKSALSYKFTEPLESARAKEILDAPPANVTARLAKPAVRIELTFKSGKKTRVEVSSASGDFVYARTSDSPAVLKLDKQTLKDLTLTAADVAG